MSALDRIRRALRKVDEAQPDGMILCSRGRYDLAPEEAEAIRDFDAWLRDKSGKDVWLREEIAKEQEQTQRRGPCGMGLDRPPASYGDGGSIT